MVSCAVGRQYLFEPRKQRISSSAADKLSSKWSRKIPQEIQSLRRCLGERVCTMQRPPGRFISSIHYLGKSWPFSPLVRNQCCFVQYLWKAMETANLKSVFSAKLILWRSIKDFAFPEPEHWVALLR